MQREDVEKHLEQLRVMEAGLHNILEEVQAPSEDMSHNPVLTVEEKKKLSHDLVQAIVKNNIAKAEEILTKHNLLNTSITFTLSDRVSAVLPESFSKLITTTTNNRKQLKLTIFEYACLEAKVVEKPNLIKALLKFQPQVYKADRDIDAYRIASDVKSAYPETVPLFPIVLEYGWSTGQFSAEEKRWVSANRAIQDNNMETLMGSIAAPFSTDNAKSMKKFYTLLEYAVKFGREEMVKAIRVHYPLPLLFKNNLESKLLDYAITYGQARMVQTLIQEGVNIHTFPHRPDSPLMGAYFRLNKETIAILHAAGARLSWHQAIVLFRTIKDLKFYSVLECLTGEDSNLLEAYLFPVKEKEGVKETFLSDAVGARDYYLVQSLLDIKVNPSKGASNGDTPLHVACTKGYVEMAELLLARGANIHAKNCEGYTPLDYACDVPHLPLIKILIEQGANSEIHDQENLSPFHSVCCKCSPEIVSYLIEKGAKVNGSNVYGFTPIHFATMEGNVENIRVLLEKRADVDARDGFGRTPLYWACLKGNEAATRLLLEKGADVKIKDKDGNTPLMVAAGPGNWEKLKPLLRPYVFHAEIIRAERNASIITPSLEPHRIDK